MRHPFLEPYSKTQNWEIFLNPTRMLGIARSRLAVKILGSKSALDTAIAGSDKTGVVAWFTASWCGPCKAITPSIEKLSESMKTVEIFKIDVDENGPIAEEFEVESVPTFVMFKNKEVAGRVLGANAQKVEELMKHNS
jgi:thioredoxin 1